MKRTKPADGRKNETERLKQAPKLEWTVFNPPQVSCLGCLLLKVASRICVASSVRPSNHPPHPHLFSAIRVVWCYGRWRRNTYEWMAMSLLFLALPDALARARLPPIWWCLAWIHFHAACPCQTELLWVVTHMPLSLWEFLTTHRRTGGTCGVTTTSTFIVSHCHRGSRREAHSFIVCLSLAASVSVSSSAHLDLIVWHVRHTQHKRNRGGSRVGVL